MSGNAHFPTIVKRLAFLTWGLFLLPSAVHADTAVQGLDPQSAESSSLSPKPPVTAVVSATRHEIPVEKATRALTVITKDQIKRSGKVFLLDFLRGQPGVTVAQLGGFGRESRIFIRGVDAQSTLVMVDGVQINTMNQQLAGLEHMTTANIERIEILRGPQSVLYGADASGGIIHIITKPDAEKGVHAGGRFEFGMHKTFYEEGTLSASNDRFSFTAGGSRLDSDGISENNDYENTTARFHGKAQITENSELDAAFHYFTTLVGIDDGFRTVGGRRVFQADPNRSSLSRQQVLNTRYSVSLTEWWDQYVQYSFFHDKGFVIDPRNPGAGGADPELANFKSDGDRHTFEYQSNIYIQDVDVLTFGYEFEHSNFTSTYNQLTRNHGWFVQNELTLWDIWTIVAGIRIDDHDLYGVQASPLVSTGLWVDATRTRIKGSFGRGFRSPTFNQLFFPNFGNPDLMPESSWSWDAGFEQYYGDERGSFSAMVFDSWTNDQIQNTATGPLNVARAHSVGVELENRIRIVDGVDFVAGYTYTHSIDRDTRKRLTRVPRHAGKFGLAFDRGRFHGSADWIWAGTRNDSIGGGSPFVTVDEFSRLDLALAFDVTEFAQIYGRVENANNDHYFEAAGYHTPSTRFIVGARLEV